MPLFAPSGKTLLICVNRRQRIDQPSCAVRDSEALARALEREIAARGLAVSVERTVCMGRCAQGPTLRVAPGGAFHLGLREDDVPGFLDRLEADLNAQE